MVLVEFMGLQKRVVFQGGNVAGCSEKILYALFSWLSKTAQLSGGFVLSLTYGHES